MSMQAKKAMMRLMQAEHQGLAMSTSLLRVHEELNRLSREYMGPGDGAETELTPTAEYPVELASVD